MNGQNKSVLIVDDMRSLRLTMRRICANLGITKVVEASNGIEALQHLENMLVPIHLVLSDVNMPEMGGLDLLYNIKQNPHLKHIPVVLITTEGDKDFVLKALSLDPSGYIIKPFKNEVLQEKIQTVLKIK